MPYEILLQHVSIVPCLCVFGISHFGLYYLYSRTKNIPFEGVITEADSGKIVVKGDGTNGCGLTEHYQIYNSDQIKIVNTNDELIQFTDLKKGTRISMRLWIKEKTLYNDMDRLDIVTLIQCCE